MNDAKMTPPAKLNWIPPITDPMGIYWDQPDPSEIEVDETHALMSEATFKKLHEYSCTQPTGVYVGKMWRSCRAGVWRLVWFGHDIAPGYCSNNSRKIIIV